jgi:hypothetical protein
MPTVPIALLLNVWPVIALYTFAEITGSSFWLYKMQTLFLTMLHIPAMLIFAFTRERVETKVGLIATFIAIQAFMIPPIVWLIGAS